MATVGDNINSADVYQVIKSAILGFDWDNYGLDEVTDATEECDWAEDLAKEIQYALSGDGDDCASANLRVLCAHVLHGRHRHHRMLARAIQVG